MAIKLSQRPDRQELIERNILRTGTEEERRMDRYGFLQLQCANQCFVIIVGCTFYRIGQQGSLRNALPAHISKISKQKIVSDQMPNPVIWTC